MLHEHYRLLTQCDHFESELYKVENPVILIDLFQMIIHEYIRNNIKRIYPIVAINCHSFVNLLNSNVNMYKSKYFYRIQILFFYIQAYYHVS